MSKIILGLDPGTRFVGYAVLAVKGSDIRVLGHGVMVPEHPEENVAQRLLELGKTFCEILKQFKPHEVVVEKSFFHKNPDTAFKLGQSRGVFIYEALKAEAVVAEYAVRAVKKTVTGDGGADKLVVSRALQSLLGVKQFASFDASDALALAYHHVTQLRRQDLMKRGIEK